MPNEPKLSHSRGRPPTQHAQERSRCTATEKRGGSAQLGRSPLEADAIAVWIFEIPLFHAVVSNNRLLHINELGARECKPPSISDPQKVLPFAKFALEAHALRYLERCDDAPLDLLAGFASSFAGSPILPPGLIEVGNEPVTLDGRL